MGGVQAIMFGRPSSYLEMAAVGTPLIARKLVTNAFVKGLKDPAMAAAPLNGTKAARIGVMGPLATTVTKAATDEMGSMCGGRCWTSSRWNRRQRTRKREVLKRLNSILILMVLLAVASRARAASCPANVLPSGSLTSCWVPPTSGPATSIPDVIDSNPLTIQGASSYALPGNGISCQGIGRVGCDLSTTVSYSNPQPITLLIAFSGTGGPLAQFGSTSSAAPFGQYYELFVDTYGRLSWGADSYGNLNVLQNQDHMAYGDGNEHIAGILIGPSGMRMYADGALIGNNSVTLANYSQGYWFFGGAALTGAAPGKTWPYAPPQSWFNGTIYYAAWWNGTQLTDAQAEAATLPGGAINPITNDIDHHGVYRVAGTRHGLRARDAGGDVQYAGVAGIVSAGMQFDGAARAVFDDLYDGRAG